MAIQVLVPQARKCIKQITVGVEPPPYAASHHTTTSLPDLCWGRVLRPIGKSTWMWDFIAERDKALLAKMWRYDSLIVKRKFGKGVLQSLTA